MFLLGKGLAEAPTNLSERGESTNWGQGEKNKVCIRTEEKTLYGNIRGFSPHPSPKSPEAREGRGVQ